MRLDKNQITNRTRNVPINDLSGSNLFHSVRNFLNEFNGECDSEYLRDLVCALIDSDDSESIDLISELLDRFNGVFSSEELCTIIASFIDSDNQEFIDLIPGLLDRFGSVLNANDLPTIVSDLIDLDRSEWVGPILRRFLDRPNGEFLSTGLRDIICDLAESNNQELIDLVPRFLDRFSSALDALVLTMITCVLINSNSPESFSLIPGLLDRFGSVLNLTDLSSIVRYLIEPRVGDNRMTMVLFRSILEYVTERFKVALDSNSEHNAECLQIMANMLSTTDGQGQNVLMIAMKNGQYDLALGIVGLLQSYDNAILETVLDQSDNEGGSARELINDNKRYDRAGEEERVIIDKIRECASNESCLGMSNAAHKVNLGIRTN